MKKILLFVIISIFLTSFAFAQPVMFTNTNADSMEGVDWGTMSDGKMCSYDATNTEVDCNTTFMEGTDWGTLTDTNVCRYDLTGTEIDCNLTTDGTGDCASGAVCLGDHTHSGYQTVLTNSAGLAGALSDETGTGLAVFNNMPSIYVKGATSTGGALAVNTTTIATAAGDYDLPDECDSATFAWACLYVRDAAETASLTVTDSGDTIVYKGIVPPLDADDELDSPGAAQDSVCVVCMEANKWYVTSNSGAWTDGGVAD